MSLTVEEYRCIFTRQSPDIPLAVIPKRLVYYTAVANEEHPESNLADVVSDMVDDMRQLLRVMYAGTAEPTAGADER